MKIKDKDKEKFMILRVGLVQFQFWFWFVSTCIQDSIFAIESHHITHEINWQVRHVKVDRYLLAIAMGIGVGRSSVTGAP